MSERRQREARDRRDAAEQRGANARDRADRNRQRGDKMLARLHDDAADLQAEAAQDAEDLRQADVRIEGDQLGEDSEGATGDEQQSPKRR